MRVKDESVEALNKLMIEILKIPGDKIITLAKDDQLFTVDVNREGIFGYQIGVKELFLAKTLNALCDGGAIIIREFLPVKVKKTMPNGKEIWIPEKRVYGLALGDGKWTGLSREQLQECYTTDANTGESLVENEVLNYEDFPL